MCHQGTYANTVGTCMQIWPACTPAHTMAYTQLSFHKSIKKNLRFRHEGILGYITQQAVVCF